MSSAPSRAAESVQPTEPRRGFVRSFASWPFVLRELLLALLSGLVSIVLAAVALGVTRGSLGERWQTGGADQVLHYQIFSSAMHTFPYFPNSQLGFPAVQNLFFAPLFDLWSAIEVWVLSAVLPNGIYALNIYNLLSFFAVGFTAYAFFRALTLRRLTSVVFGVAFALIPYHFYQLQLGHPFLSNYWAVPLSGILVLMVAGERTDPFSAWIGRATTRSMRRARRWVPILVLCALVAWTQSYYFVFACLIVGGIWAVKLVLSFVTSGGWRRAAWPTVTTFVLVGLVGVQLAVLSLNLGDRFSTYFTARLAIESELYGGKVMNLLLPSSTSGFPLLAKPSIDYDATSTVLTTTESAVTATLVTIALILALATLLVRLLRSYGPAGTATTRLQRFTLDDRVGVLLAALVGAFLFFVVSGLGALIAFAVTPEIRAWTRMSVVISLFALGILAIFFDSLVRRGWIRVVALAAVALFAGVDQLAGIQASYPIQATDDVAQREIAAKTDSLLGPGCGVVELPLKSFPESGNIGKMGDYDEALPYIYDEKSDLEWSYGAVAGTHSADFWYGVTDPSVFASKVESSKACAILVDTYAYSDSGATWQPLVAAVTDANSPTFTTSDADHRYELFVVPAGR
ncbi:hypothetical protein [Subtercola sp. RTI3]|uniref:hypothetical protein n=1 Tax=Subtercola sp. RTI3 TaxID=3048639 RepID=UPI002B23BCBC|nr:hypothetical protein [Subtercola sp. RTI3]MEA9984431.1 hypothetical protein [Subtercola sp. RTI3]